MLIDVRLYPVVLYIGLVFFIDFSRLREVFERESILKGELVFFSSHPISEIGWGIQSPTVLYTFHICTVQWPKN